ncbi:MAG: hypothetical protein ACLQPH_09885 [Acidimicrobiales bacterium]
MQQLSLQTRVDRLADDPPIELASVDLTAKDPARLRRLFDEIFAYIATVEGSVPQNVADVTVLLPDLDDQERRFLGAWSGHELAHAAIFDALRAELGLPPADGGGRPGAGDDRDGMGARPAFRVLGTLSRSRWLQDVFKLVYLARGAMHEHLTYDCYRHLGARLDALDEPALARTVTDPIRRQEAAHLGYYRLAATTHRRRLTPTQVRLARSISVRTYTLVGAGPCGREPSARVCAGLAGDDVDAVLDAVEALAGQLLGNGTQPLPHFVHDEMAQCLGGRRSGRVRQDAAG